MSEHNHGPCPPSAGCDICDWDGTKQRIAGLESDLAAAKALAEEYRECRDLVQGDLEKAEARVKELESLNEKAYLVTQDANAVSKAAFLRVNEIKKTFDALEDGAAQFQRRAEAAEASRDELAKKLDLANRVANKLAGATIKNVALALQVAELREALKHIENGAATPRMVASEVLSKPPAPSRASRIMAVVEAAVEIVKFSPAPKGQDDYARIDFGNLGDHKLMAAVRKYRLDESVESHGEEKANGDSK